MNMVYWHKWQLCSLQVIIITNFCSSGSWYYCSHLGINLNINKKNPITTRPHTTRDWVFCDRVNVIGGDWWLIKVTFIEAKSFGGKIQNMICNHIALSHLIIVPYMTYENDMYLHREKLGMCLTNVQLYLAIKFPIYSFFWAAKENVGGPRWAYYFSAPWIII